MLRSAVRPGADATGLGLFTSYQYLDALPFFRQAAEAADGVDDDSAGENLHWAGLCYWSAGCYDEALRFFAHSETSARRGSAHGAIDYVGIAERHSEIGLGHLRAGRSDDALAWFERAANTLSETSAGMSDATTLLGQQLYLIGACHLQGHRHDQALPFFRRAAQAAQGRGASPSDPDSLGKCLYMTGVCHARSGRFAEALALFVSAAQAAKQGDAQGRVHPENIVRAQNAQAATRQRLGCQP